MQEKFDKYFEIIPPIFIVAHVLEFIKLVYSNRVIVDNALHCIHRILDNPKYSSVDVPVIPASSTSSSATAGDIFQLFNATAPLSLSGVNSVSSELTTYLHETRTVPVYNMIS